PPLQALHRGLPHSGRRGLCGRRGAEGRVRRLSGVGRHQQTLPRQAVGARLPSPAGDGLDEPRPHAGGRVRHHGLARGDVQRSRARSDGRRARGEKVASEFYKETMEKDQWWIKKYPESRRKTAVIPILWLAQKQEGWVSDPALSA